MPQGLRGVTGFTDLDGGTSGYNEGVELVSGFDGAFTSVPTPISPGSARTVGAAPRMKTPMRLTRMA